MKKEKYILKVWAVFSTHDEYGSYDEVDDLIGVWADKASAEKKAEGHGWYGGMGAVVERFAVLSADDKWYLTQNQCAIKINKKWTNSISKARASALKKLTKIERMALGITT